MNPIVVGKAAKVAKDTGLLKKGLIIASLFIGAFLLFIAFMIVVMMMAAGMLTGEDKKEVGASWTTGKISSFGANQIPKKYIPIYKAAEKRYHVPWNVLAGIHRVETVFSTNLSISYAGAIGHTQFMTCTWVGWNYPGCSGLGNASVPKNVLTDPAKIKQYGGYGVDADGDGKADPYNLKDAIFSTANYLAKNGASNGHIEQAVFAYNHSQEYVSNVLGFADKYVDSYVAVGGDSFSSKVLDGTSWPLPGVHTITSTFGMRSDPFNHNKVGHDGVDIAGAFVMGKPVASYADGHVIYAGVQGGYGNCIMIDHGNFVTLYGHLSKIGVKVGQNVNAGQHIGNVGSTGRSTGPHLHFTVRVNNQSVNPLKYLKNFDYKIIGS